MADVQVLVLAAGRSSRFGSQKLLHPLTPSSSVLGETLSQLAILGTSVGVLCSPDNPGVIDLAKIFGCESLVFPEVSPGLGDSIAFGVSKTSPQQGWLVCLADMPWIKAATYAKIVARARGSAEQNSAIVAPQFQGQRGHPVFFGVNYRNSLERLTGDTGAKSILANHSAAVDFYELDDPGILRDVDVPSDIR
ncbi:NTP transferase domain-containing protein [Teredinibacter turnerae]|uniref:nucleotidyltransferase family protein n=1 Tax=Teredinibacter turnerae TaxID=2426 RepID=UPI00048AB2B8|nr:nucleotidyltransferase family protein [Teredinibacter turnerae]